MSAALLDAPSRSAVAGGVDPPARRPTLEDIVAPVWAAVAAGRSASCPVCGGAMTPRYGASGSRPLGGRCGDCGSALA